MAETKTGAPPQFASIYVGDLNRDVTEAQLYEIFNAVGQVGSIRVCRDRNTRVSLGYAYVNFHNVADAERALDTLNYSQIKGRSCRLMWSQRDSSVRASGVGNIYVKNLDPNIDNKGLFDTFSLFGNILSCKVASNKEGVSLGHGFVQFETEESAKEAIEKVDGVLVGEMKVEVHPFEKKEKDDKAAEKKEEKKNAFKNLYIKSFPKDWDDAKLKEVFGPFGDITAVAVRKDWKERPFAFVDFANAADAQKCVAELHLKEMRSPEQVAADDAESGKVMPTDEGGHLLHQLFVGKFESKAERTGGGKGGGWKGDDGGKGKGGGKKGGGWGGGGKGGWQENNWGGSSWAKGGQQGFPGLMPPNMMPGMMGGMPGMPMGVKGKPMVSNPQQMMAMLSMMGKGPPMMGNKGYGPPMMDKGYGKGMPQGGPPPPQADFGPPLNTAALQAVPPAVQKQMIGEKLFKHVAKYQPDMAAKITGMMLEMKNDELLMLLESETRLKRQIDMALSVLQSDA